MRSDHHTRRPTRCRFSPCVEGLEDRQLLSASAVAAGLHPGGGLNAQPAGIRILGMQPNAGTAPSAGPYTPAQIRAAYGINLLPNKGQGTTVAIVDAFNDPNITSDLALFSNIFGLPQMNGVGGNPTFQVLTPTGQPAPANAPHNDWAIEISLDVEWVHSVAPLANIDLIETTDNSFDHLFAAEVDGQPYSSGVQYAASLPGVDVVSNSYGSSEFAGESAYDAEFTTPGGHNPVSFFFSTGDSGAPGSYPAYSPNVVAVGGTNLYTLSARGAYGSEIGWSGGGGGVSAAESGTPAFQSNNGVNFGNRSTPDVAMDAAPNTGVLVIDQYDFPGSFIEVGGTSLATPMWAGVVALADQTRATSLSSADVLNSLYGAYNSPNYLTDFHDVTTGNNGFAAGVGYDLVTGIGTPKTQNVVPLLAGAGAPAAAPATVRSPMGLSPAGLSGAGIVTKAEPITGSLPANAISLASSGATNGTIDGKSVLVAVQGSEPIAQSIQGQPAPIATSSVTSWLDRSNSPAGSADGTLDATASASTLSRLEISIGSDGDASGTVAAVAALDTTAPAMFAETASDAVFADPATGSLVDNVGINDMATAAAALPVVDGSHASKIAMIVAGAALVLNPSRNPLARLKSSTISGRRRREPQ
jgi:hypothetical protein